MQNNNNKTGKQTINPCVTRHFIYLPNSEVDKNRIIRQQTNI